MGVSPILGNPPLVGNIQHPGCGPENPLAGRISLTQHKQGSLWGLRRRHQSHHECHRSLGMGSPTMETVLVGEKFVEEWYIVGMYRWDIGIGCQLGYKWNRLGIEVGHHGRIILCELTGCELKHDPAIIKWFSYSKAVMSITILFTRQ